MILLTLPFPPSVNRIWRQYKGRVLLSKEGREYRRRVWEIWRAHVDASFGDAQIRVAIDAYMPDARHRDIDNLNKAALDAMQACGMFEDDSQVADLHIRRMGIDRANPRLEVKLEEI